MNDIKARLEKGVAALQSLERRRRETRSPLLGYNAEFLIIAAELRQLEADIFSDPGALELRLAREIPKP
jgi:hypothetical protein